jgi:hypothetical protein
VLSLNENEMYEIRIRGSNISFGSSDDIGDRALSASAGGMPEIFHREFVKQVMADSTCCASDQHETDRSSRNDIS